MNEDDAGQDLPERPTDAGRRRGPSDGRPYASPGGGSARREPPPADEGAWGQIPVDEPDHEDGPSFGSVDSHAYTPAGRRPPQLLLGGCALILLHGAILLIEGISTSQAGLEKLSALLFGAILLAAGLRITSGQRWARYAVYALEVLTIVGTIQGETSGVAAAFFLVLNCSIIVLISLPESTAFFRARARR